METWDGACGSGANQARTDDPDVPFPTLGQAVAHWARRQPEKAAFIDGARTTSYRDMATLVCRVAASLAASGVGKGSSVAAALPAGVGFAALLFACMRVGANLVPFDLNLSDADIRRRLALVHPALTFWERAAHAQVAMEEGYRTVILEAPAADSPAHALFGEFLQPATGGLVEGPCEESASEPPASGAPDGAPRADIPAITIFTSGSTGDPKGVMLSEAALGHANRSLRHALGAASSDVMLTALPMSHIYGVNAGILLPMMVGATSVLLPKFEPGAVLDAIERHRATTFNGVPSMFQRMVAAQREAPRDLSSLARASIAGAQCDGLERYREVLGCEARVLYGLTECPFIATTCPGDSLDTDETGVGRFVSQVVGGVVDAEGNPVPAGGHGEVVCKSPGVMLGYLNPADADRACIDAQGWVHTDDIGYLDEKGFLHVVGRKSAVVNRGGYKVYPPEVERLYHGNRAVADCCAMGFPHLELGQQTVLFVELAEPGHTPAELRDFAKGRIAKYKIPDQVVLVKQMPRLANGKHDKQALARIFEEDPTVFHSDAERRRTQR